MLIMSSFLFVILNKQYIWHGRKSNLAEFQILPVESPIGVSTGRKSNQGDLGIALGSEI